MRYSMRSRHTTKLVTFVSAATSKDTCYIKICQAAACEQLFGVLPKWFFIGQIRNQSNYRNQIFRQQFGRQLAMKHQGDRIDASPWIQCLTDLSTDSL